MAFKIAVASGKGGTGKTTVSVNLFHALSNELNAEVQLIDCDVEEPNDAIFFPEGIITNEESIFQLIPTIDTEKCTFCRKCVAYCEFNAIAVVPSEKFAEVNASLCHSCGACSVACKFDAITEMNQSIGTLNSYDLDSIKSLLEGKLRIGSTMQTLLIKELKKHVAPHNKIEIYDAPPGTSCPVVETISDADYVVLVTEPTPFGLYDLQLMVDLLVQIEKPFGVIINKAGLGNNEIYHYIDAKEIELLGEIPFNQEYASCYAHGNLVNEIPVVITESFNKISDKLKERISS
jgi:MinD superfamily P-loop ATPase